MSGGYLARKIKRRTSLEKLKAMSDEEILAMPIEDARALLPYDGPLSFWQIESLAEMETAAKAICLASSRVDSFSIIAIDTAAIEQMFNIECTPGVTKAKNLASLHRDISGINDDNIRMLLKMYKDAASSNRVYKYAKQDLKSIIQAMHQDGQIIFAEPPDTLTREIYKIVGIN